LKDQSKTKQALIQELASLRQRIQEMERSDSVRKQAEEALRASQHIIEGIINTIPVRVFWKDKNLVFLGCNAAFARDAGFADPKDIIGKDDYQMVWRDQAELYRGDDRHVIESGCSKFFIEEPQKTPEGNTITLLTSKIPLRSSKEEISGVLGTYMDITDRKQVEEALLNSERRLHTLVQTIPDLIWLKDKDGVYLSCNTMFERFFGAKEVDIVGKTDYDFVDRELADSFREHDNKAMAAGKTTSNEEWITFADDGHRVFLDTIKTPMYDAWGTLSGVLGIGRDITDRRSVDRIRKALGGTVQAIAVTVEARDPYTAGHQRRVADLARAIATEMNLPIDIIDGIRMAAAIHDLGKISVPAEILSKPTKLKKTDLI
jgi:PAS domain S-box-containing protein